MRIDLDHIKEMHRSIGHALAHWQYVETGLYLVTHCLLDTKHELSSIMFFHIESARSKLSVTDKLCKQCFKQSTYQRHWLPLKKDINPAIDIRNALAHFDVSGVDPAKTKRKSGAPTAFPLMLTPNSHDESAVRSDGSVKALYVEDLHETSAWFRSQARGLLEFVSTHIPDWQPRTASLPPETQRLIARSDITSPTSYVKYIIRIYFLLLSSELHELPDQICRPGDTKLRIHFVRARKPPRINPDKFCFASSIHLIPAALHHVTAPTTAQDGGSRHSGSRCCVDKYGGPV